MVNIESGFFHIWRHAIFLDPTVISANLISSFFWSIGLNAFTKIEKRNGPKTVRRMWIYSLDYIEKKSNNNNY